MKQKWNKKGKDKFLASTGRLLVSPPLLFPLKGLAREADAKWRLVKLTREPKKVKVASNAGYHIFFSGVFPQSDLNMLRMHISFPKSANTLSGYYLFILFFFSYKCQLKFTMNDLKGRHAHKFDRSWKQDWNLRVSKGQSFWLLKCEVKYDSFI